MRLIVRRVKPTPGSQLALFASYSYHGFITDRDGDTLELEADHRRHAEVENAIRDLKYGVGLNHLPSGRFAANAAWLAVQVLAHNLARWAARIGLGKQSVTTKTLRRRFFSLAARLTRSARLLTLHLPQGWPWENQFSSALARLRALPDGVHPVHPTTQRHQRGDLQVDGTERPGVPEYPGQLRTVKNLPTPATGGTAPERWHPLLFLILREVQPTESIVEAAAPEWLTTTGWQVAHGVGPSRRGNPISHKSIPTMPIKLEASP